MCFCFDIITFLLFYNKKSRDFEQKIESELARKSHPVPKCIRMKNIKTQSFWTRLVLGVFLVFFLMPMGQVNAEDFVKCSSLIENPCDARSDCKWVKGETVSIGTPEADRCEVQPAECRILKEETCEEYGCDWRKGSDECVGKAEICTGRTWAGCGLDADCRWNDGKCMLSAAKQDAKAVGTLDGICNEEIANSQRNDFWIEKIPSLCIPPITNKGVQHFCETNADLLTSYGKKQCRRGIVHVIKAGEQKCLDDSEMRFQRSLKDSAAREQRRANDASCRANASYIYDGPVFEGGGLRSGAILAHENLTKSISHSTDLKGLIINWTKFILEIVAVIAVIAVIWAGILYITDMGDGGNIEKAKKILMWVAIGILVILGSYAIVNTLMKADFGSNRVAIITPFDA